MNFLAPTSFSKKLKFFNRWIPTGPLYIRSTPKWPRILCCSAACFFSLVKFEAGTSEHWKHPINQWINQIYLFTYQYLAIYLWLSLHISKPIFQSTKLSQSTKLAMSGLLTLNLTAMTRHSCSLSNFLLPWLVFQQQQLILAKNSFLPSCLARRCHETNNQTMKWGFLAQAVLSSRSIRFYVAK